jgi:hypothetical protein
VPNSEDKVKVLKERSQKLFTATLTILGLLFLNTDVLPLSKSWEIKK